MISDYVPACRQTGKLRPINMNGFTKIENKLFEKILTSNFTKRQLKILLLIVRFSFGCQKNYAILKNQDFTYAQVSPYCIKVELMKLIEKRVIERDSEKGMILINKNLNEWTVDNSGNNPVDNSYRFIKIANKNLPKQNPMKCCLLKHPLLRAYCSFLRIFVLRAFPNYSATSLI
jgi:phage replication O-like protein O